MANVLTIKETLDVQHELIKQLEEKIIILQKTVEPISVFPQEKVLVSAASKSETALESSIAGAFRSNNVQIGSILETLDSILGGLAI